MCEEAATAGTAQVVVSSGSAEREFWDAFAYDSEANRWSLAEHLAPMDVLEASRAKLEADGRAVAAVIGQPDAARLLASLSSWIDDAPANQERDGEAATWGRLAKVAEECGEVVSAFIGATGQNPRKGVTHNLAHVRKELLDVAVTALCAVEHLDGNGGSSMAALEAHVAFLARRAGLMGEASSEGTAA